MAASTETGFDPTILAAVISALISAVVSFLVVWYKTYVLDPKRKEAEERTLRRQLLVTWIAQTKHILEAVSKPERRLEKLAVDDRPLDRLALAHGQLVEDMTQVRSQILALNRELELYDAAMGPALKYLVMANPWKGESYPLQQLDSGETDIARRMQQWRGDYLKLIDSKRATLLPHVEKLKNSLQKALEQETG